MLRSLFAVLAGFIVATVLVLLSTAISVRALLPPAGPGAMPDPTIAYLLVNLCLGAMSATAGGWIAAWMAGRAALGHGMALGTVLLLLGFASAALTSDGTKGSQPGWYLYAMATLGWGGATLGGLLRAGSEEGKARGGTRDGSST